MLREAAPFDWVTAFEVLEHQPDPLGFLRAARGLLVPGGRLCGSVPNRDRVLASRERSRSDGDFPPHHFLWFSHGSLEATLRAAGFSQVRVEPIAERDPEAFAAYLENALLGSLTGAGKRAVRRAVERADHGGAGAGAGGSSSSSSGSGGSSGSSNSGSGRGDRARRLMKAARRLKNAPFVPAALLLSRLAPGRARALYFEAS
jgi:hypothetical protein